MAGLRTDIQALRGWAVAIVVLDHAGLEAFHSGFLGVDIFFVISGFLITSILARTIADGSFTFANFYFLRARRILPAAYVTIALTAIGAIWFLTSLEMASLRDQTLGALTYTINFVLWHQVDYFAADANLKPLLHMWSLAVEEQFYILLPLLLFVTPARFWRALVAVLTVASFAFCIWWQQSEPTGAFYMLPSRAWELGIGACAALFPVRREWFRPLFWPALAIVLAAPFVPFEFAHPGWLAAALCIATAVVILAANQRVAASMPVRAAGRLGDISYSLYLVHWPVMVFAYSGYMGEPPAWLPAVVIAISLVLAYAMFRFVETPARQLSQPSWLFTGGMVAATALVVGVYFVSAWIAKPAVDFEQARAPNYGFDRKCDYSGAKTFQPFSECQNSDKPSVLVWGDSYAMHLVGGLAEKNGVVQATFSACPPFLGYALKRKNFDKAEIWARRCIDFGAYVMSYVKQQPTIETVVLASPWRDWVAPGASAIWSRAGDGLEEHVSGPAFALEALGGTIKGLQSMGKAVVLVGPPPASGKDTSACLERVHSGKIILGGDCSIPNGPALRADAPVRTLLTEAASKFGAKTLLLSDSMCDAGTCATQADGVAIYRDGGHLSNAGSLIVFDMMRRKGALAAVGIK